jgi:hypothetical protein
MVYLANVPSVETPWGIECYTQHAHVSVDYPIDDNPFYFVMSHFGTGSRNFARFDQAMDYASRLLKQAEPA